MSEIQTDSQEGTESRQPGEAKSAITADIFTYRSLLNLFGIRPLPAAKHPESSK